MENVLGNITKRAGTIGDLQGTFYEIQVIFLFMIRACLNNVKFTLANNIEGFGNFDDLVASCELPDGTKKLICLQSKHLKDSEKSNINFNKITNEKEKSFNLNKYREEILKAGSKIRDYKDVDLIFYTTVSIDDSDKSLSWCNVDKNDILCKLLDTSDTDNCVRKFSQSGNDVLVKKVANDQEFVKKIKIFFQQCREENIEAIIKNSLTQIVGNQMDDIVNNIYQNIKSKLEKWFKNEKAVSLCNETFISWTWTNVLKEVTCLSIEEKLKKISSKFSICDERIENLRKQIAEHRTLIIKSENTSTSLAALEMFQAVKDDPSHMFVNLQDLDQVLPLFEHCKDLIIVDCSEDTELGSINMTVIKNIISKNKRKRAILLVSNTKLRDLNLLRYELSNYNFDFKSLTPATKKYIFEREILLQGNNVRLNELFHENNVCDVIDCATVEKLFKHEVVEVGAKLPELDEETKTCYIERSYHNTNVLDREVLDIDTESDILVVCVERASDLGTHERHFENYKQLSEYNTSKKLYFINQNLVQHNKNVTIPSIPKNIIDTYPNKDIHLLEIMQSHILWIKTAGSSVANIKKYVTTCTLLDGEMSGTGENVDSLLNSGKQLNIIVDSAGKGKTTALRKIAKKLKKNKETCLVLYYDLNSKEMFKILNKMKSEKPDQLNAEQIFKKYFYSKNTTFELSVILYLLRNNKVVFCFDGFDEISQRYDEECMSLIKHLQSVAKQIWLTSREHMESYIERHLLTFPIRLLPITEQDQIEFYIKYFKFYLKKNHRQVNDQEIEDFAREIFASIAGVDKSIVEFMGIPLLTKMLASINLTNVLNHHDSNIGTKLVPVQLTNLYDLYLNFFDLSIKRYLKEKRNEDLLSSYCNLNEKERLKYHILIAFTSVVNNNFHSLLTDAEREILKNKTELQNQITGVGIITSYDQDNAKFLHFTFAEFLVASFISNKLTNSENNSQLQALLDEILLEGRWRMVRKFLNNSPYINKATQDKTEDDQNQEASVSSNSVRVNIETKNKYNRLTGCVEIKKTSLYIAVEENNCNIANFTINCLRDIEREKYISFQIFDVRHMFKASALHRAVALGHKEEAELLLNYNADSFNEDDSKDSLLLTAARSGHVDVVTLLLDRGADVHFKDWYGKTALILAALSGHVDVMTLLLDRGADVNHEDGYGQTALIQAAERGNVDVMTLLLDRGADVHRAGFHNTTAILRAARSSTVETLKLLHARGASLDDKDMFGRTLLMCSAMNSSHDVITYVVSQGRYDIHDRDNIGWTALHRAAARGHSLNMKTLLDLGADINSQDNDGNTPLHGAVRPSSLQCVQYLCQRGADRSVKNKSGKTVLDVECPRDETKRWLRQNINICDIEVRGELTNRLY